MRKNGSLYLFLAALLWSLGGLLTKSSSWNGYCVGAVRGMSGFVLTALLCRRLPKRPTKRSLLRAFCFFAQGLLIVAANKYTTAANATVLQYTSSIHIIVFGAIASRTLPKRRDVVTCAVLFSGVATSTAQNECLAFRFTQHVGGTFDASQMRTDSRLYVEYSGAKYGVYLALSSHSGATQWAKVNASETVEVSEGRYGAYFDESAMAMAFGSNFARLDQISVYSSGKQPVTLHKLAYFAGTGDVVDTSGGRWDRPDTGIAFIGDSICQNAKLLYGDWNTILGRSDCANYGIGGQTTLECRARIGELAARNYRQIVFICGINDIGHGYTKEEIVQNYAAMIETVQASNPDCQFVILSTLPTTSAFYSGQQGKITLLNLAFKRFANKTPNVTFVDAYSAFCPKAGEYAYPELLSDGLHPNAEGYAKIAEMFTPYLLPEAE